MSRCPRCGVKECCGAEYDIELEAALAAREKAETLSESYRDAMNRIRDEMERQAQMAVRYESERDEARKALAEAYDDQMPCTRLHCDGAISGRSWRKCPCDECAAKRKAAGV